MPRWGEFMRSGFQRVFSINNQEGDSRNTAKSLELPCEWRREMVSKEFGKTLAFCTWELKSGDKNARMKPEPEAETAE